MENLRLGVSAVQHDMKREETVEEVEKNTELERQTPKRQATGSNPAGGAKSTAASHFLLVCSVFCFASPGLLLVWNRENFMRCNVYPAKKKRTISMFLLRKIPSLLIGVFGLTCRPVPPRAAQPGYLPVPATAGAVPPVPPGQASPVPVPSAPPGDGPPEDPAWHRRRSQTSGR